MVQESDKNAPKQTHTLRPADSTVIPLTPQEAKYWGRIASRTTSILKAKIAKGELKRSGRKRGGHANRLVLLAVALVGVVIMSAVYAEYNGQITVQTQLVTPITCPQTTLTIPNILMNKTSSLILDNICYLDTSSRQTQFTFLAYGSATINGTVTQDMTKLFSNFQIIYSDYTTNMTHVSLLTPNQPVTFTYNNAVNQPMRIIIQYSSKPVQLGASNNSPLIITFLYSYTW